MEDLKNKPEEYWKKKLSLDEYRVIRQKGTEPAFTGKFVNNKDKGVYTCAACGQKLFSSDTKFDSGTGWPSFTDPMNPVRSLARAKGASPEDLGEATSNGIDFSCIYPHTHKPQKLSTSLFLSAVKAFERNFKFFSLLNASCSDLYAS